MEKNLIVLILVILASVAVLSFLLINNHKDKKDLFNKMPGDLPDPPFIESEFDKEE